MGDLVSLPTVQRQPIEAPIAHAATGTVDVADPLRVVLRIASLTARRAALLDAYRRVEVGEIHDLDAEIAALRRQLEDHHG